ncbi:MAG: Em GEA1 (EM1) [Armatimonadota bacterium]
MLKREQNPMTVSEAGRKGGRRTAETHGHDFYQEIGHKGGLKGGPKVRDLINAGKKAMGRK